jgi:sugar phosphate isomerase/epimerase
MRPGLVSVTFRKLSAVEVIRLCVANRLEAIEWGGDIHVPHGDEAAAVRVGQATREAGLSVSAYGSYYRLGVSGGDGPDFSTVLKTACALGAPAIRVWAGNCGSGDADAALRSRVADDVLRCADLAAAAGIMIAFEYHSNTLTDTVDSTCALLEATAHPMIKTLWQPPVGLEASECLAGLRRVMPWLLHVHAFHWWPDSGSRHPFRHGLDRWSAYLAEIQSAGLDPDVLLEFVRGDDPSALTDDAATLRELVSRET